MSTPRIWSLFLLFCELTGGEGAEKGWCAWPLPPSPLPVCMQVCVCSEEDEKDVDDVFLPSLPPSPHPSLPPSSVPHSGHACPENKGNSLGNHSCSSPHSPSLPPSLPLLLHKAECSNYDDGGGGGEDVAAAAAAGAEGRVGGCVKQTGGGCDR